MSWKICLKIFDYENFRGPIDAWFFVWLDVGRLFFGSPKEGMAVCLAMAEAAAGAFWAAMQGDGQRKDEFNPSRIYGWVCGDHEPVCCQEEKIG